MDAHTNTRTYNDCFILSLSFPFPFPFLRAQEWKIRSAKILELRETLMKSSPPRLSYDYSSSPCHLAAPSTARLSLTKESSTPSSTSTPAKRTPRVTFLGETTPDEEAEPSTPKTTALKSGATNSFNGNHNNSNNNNNEEGYVSWSEASSGKNSPVKHSSSSTSHYPSLTPDEGASFAASTPISRAGGGGGVERSSTRRDNVAPQKYKTPTSTKTKSNNPSINHNNNHYRTNTPSPTPKGRSEDAAAAVGKGKSKLSKDKIQVKYTP